MRLPSKRNVLRLSAAVLALAGAACSLVHSFDGFSDEFGAAADGATPDAAQLADAAQSPDAAESPDANVDAGPAPHPNVTCTVTTLAAVNGGDAPFTPDYMTDLAVTKSFVYVVAGARSKLPDGGLVTDAGALLRVDKQGGARKIAQNLDALGACAPHVSQGAACAVGTQLRLFTSNGAESTLFETKERAITEVAPTIDGAFMVTRSGGVDAVWYTPWGREDASVRQPVPAAALVRADEDAGTVYVGRFGGAGPLSAYPRATWGGPDASAADASDAAIDGCTVVGDTSRQLAMSKDALFALDSDSQVYRVEKRCRAPSAEHLFGPFYGLAADDRFVFLQRGAEVELRWADDFTNVACSVALDAGIDASPGSDTAAFDGDDVYFLAPPRVLKLHLVTVP